MRRFVQSIFLLVLCVVLGAALGKMYFVLAGTAALLAIASGVYVLLAVALGLVWPVLVLAFVLYTTSRTKQANALLAWAPKPNVSRVEDPQECERRDQS